MKTRTLFISNLLLIVASVTGLTGMANAANTLNSGNPGFETAGPANWTILSATGTTTRSGLQQNSGSYSLRFASPTNNASDRNVRSSTVPVTAGHKYHIASHFFIKNNGGAVANTDIRIRILWLNGSGVAISTGGHITGQQLSAFETWEELRVSSLTAPVGAIFARLDIDVSESTNNDNDVFLDDADLWDIVVNAPTGFTGTAQSPTSIKWGWSDAPVKEGYRVRDAANNDVSGDLTAGTTFWVETGRDPDTSTQRSVEAFVGSEIAKTALQSARTLANTPSAPVLSNISSYSITVAISTNGNPAGTEYAIKAIKNGTTFYVQTGNTLSTASPVYKTLAAWGALAVRGLSKDAKYTFTVKARNANGVETNYSPATSAYTQPATPYMDYFVFIEEDRIKPRINTNGNVNGVTYRIETSTNMDFDPLTEASPWATSDNHIFVGLIPNTTYYFRAQARSRDLIPGPYSGTSANHTHAVPPTEKQFLMVGASSVTVGWNLNGNRPGTTFELYVSQDNKNWTNTYTGSALSADVTGLGTNIEYFFRIRSVDIGGIPSFYTVEIETVTHCYIPAPPSLNPDGGTTMEMTINENGNSTSALYSIKVFHDGDAYFLLKNLTLGNTLYYDPIYQTKVQWGNPASIPNLNVNEQYGFAVNARNKVNFITDYSAIASSHTLSNIPVGGALSGTSVSSIGVSWANSGNPPGTEYLAEISTSPSFIPVLTDSGWVTGLSHSFGGLTAFTSYYFRVRSRSGQNVESANSNLGLKMVLPSDALIESLTGHVNNGKSDVSHIHFTSTNTAHFTQFRYKWGTTDRNKSYVQANGTLWDGNDLPVIAVDPGNPDGTLYYFQVLAINPIGDVSKNLSTFVIDFDTTPPHLIRVVSRSANSLVATFNEPMAHSTTTALNSVTRALNHAIPGLSISSVTTYDEEAIAYFIYTDAQIPANPYTLNTSTNVEDEYGNNLDINFSTAGFTGYAFNTAPTAMYTQTPEQSTDGIFNGDGRVSIVLDIYEVLRPLAWVKV